MFVTSNLINVVMSGKSIQMCGVARICGRDGGPFCRRRLIDDVRLGGFIVFFYYFNMIFSGFFFIFMFCNSYIIYFSDV